MEMHIKRKELRIFILILVILIIISVASTVISWNFFYSEVEVNVYNKNSSQSGGVGFEITSKNELRVLKSTDNFDKGGGENGG